MLLLNYVSGALKLCHRHYMYYYYYYLPSLIPTRRLRRKILYYNWTHTVLYTPLFGVCDAFFFVYLPTDNRLALK